MTNALVVCSACKRHIRSSEARCPFCQGEVSAEVAASARRSPTARLSRAALVALGASLAGCGTSSQPLYGAPYMPIDAATDAVSVTDSTMPTPDTATGSDVPPDSTNCCPPYGHPIVDSGTDGGPHDGGGAMPLYGSPAPDTTLC